MFKKSYTKKIQDAENAIRVIEQEREQTISRNSKDLTWMEAFRKYQNIEEIERRAVVELIENIRIHEGKRIEVTVRNQDDIERLRRFVEELPEDIRAKLV